MFHVPRRLSPARVSAVMAESKHMLQTDIIRQYECPWASPLYLVPKTAIGDRLPCGYYRTLNSVTTTDRYPVPHLQGFVGALFGKSAFSKIGLDFSETAVTTPFNFFDFLRMQFGLRNASQVFQRLVDRVICDLPFVYVYIDDLLVASSTAEEHTEKLATQGRLLDIMNFYHRYLLNRIDTILSLASLLLGPKRSSELFADALAAFNKTKTFLADDTVSTHFLSDALTFRKVDAYNGVDCTVFQQHRVGPTQALSFLLQEVTTYRFA
ncbi:hypothetical protein SprV_0602099700 [Sparganum proliferum]